MEEEDINDCIRGIIYDVSQIITNIGLIRIGHKRRTELSSWS